jgi:hypothetical protein
MVVMLAAVGKKVTIAEVMMRLLINKAGGPSGQQEGHKGVAGVAVWSSLMAVVAGVGPGVAVEEVGKEGGLVGVVAGNSDKVVVLREHQEELVGMGWEGAGSSKVEAVRVGGVGGKEGGLAPGVAGVLAHGSRSDVDEVWHFD